MKQDKLRRILDIISPEASVDFAEFDSAVSKIKEGMKEKIHVSTLSEVNRQLEKFKKSFDFGALAKAIKDIEETLNTKVQKTSLLLEGQIALLKKISQEDSATIRTIYADIGSFRNELNSLKAHQKDIEILTARFDGFSEFTRQAQKTLNEIKQVQENTPTEFDVEEVNTTIEKLRREFNNRLGNLSTGGNANRNIAVGGNTSVLSTFTDINLKAGSNVTITYSKNQTTKYTDITIAATGGGAGGGIVRSINSISSNTAAGDTTGTDFVYVCTSALTLTLPTAVGNTNLYTVKNTSNATITIATTGVETIDTQTSIQLSVQYTSVDIISNGTNWNLT